MYIHFFFLNFTAILKEAHQANMNGKKFSKKNLRFKENRGMKTSYSIEASNEFESNNIKNNYSLSVNEIESNLENKCELCELKNSIGFFDDQDLYIDEKLNEIYIENFCGHDYSERSFPRQSTSLFDQYEFIRGKKKK